MKNIFVLNLFILTTVLSSNTNPLQEIVFKNQMVDKHKVWVPMTQSLKSGEKVQLTLINTLDAPHGFEIPGHLKAIIVAPNKTTKTSFTVPKQDHIVFKCHMHAAHIGGVLKIQK